jgi:hypothetical protein
MGKLDKYLVKEKQMVFQKLIDVMNEGISSEKLTYEVLEELKAKIDSLLMSDF